MISRSYWRVQLLAISLLLQVTFFGQSADNKTDQTSPQPEPQPGEGGAYIIHQAIEFGYRGSDVTGSQAMYDSLVNLPSGPRLLDQSLSMQSRGHDGFLFDNLFITSFGWGGDPNNTLSARLDKSNWYDFRANFRRNHNDFDYNLLANPLNPFISSPSIPVPSSPHTFGTTRRMSDYDLTLLPQSRVTFRVGYSHNNVTGFSFSSVHEGTDALLNQPWNTTVNSYRFGADFKLLPHTVLSYDQFLDYYKGDTSWNLAQFASALLPAPPPGIPSSTELGLPIDTLNKNPCAVTAPATTLIESTGTLTNTQCNAFYSYNRTNRTRTSTPTERASLHGSYFQRLELSASYSYSSSDMTAPLDEFFNGLISRSDIRQETVTGPAQATAISNVADFSGSLQLSAQFRLVDTFRFWAYRIPQAFVSAETDFTCNNLNTCSLLTPISATTPTTTPSADQLSFNQSLKQNQTDLVWDSSKHYGGRIGFRYGNKVFHQIVDFITGDQNRVVVHEYTPVFAVWFKPMTTLRFNFDWEHPNYDNTITRIDPRKETRSRIQANYTIKPWATIGGSINLLNLSNADSLTNYRGHSRNYGFTASLVPKERFGLDLIYNYSDYLQGALVCFNDSDKSLAVVANAGSCTANGFNDSSNPLLTDGKYTNTTNYGMALVMIKPVPRLTTKFGYGITSVGGQIPQFNSLQPFGTLQYNYHEPVVNIALDIGHNLTAIAGYNYYQYGEKSFVGPTDPRYFHANNATVSLRWAF